MLQLEEQRAAASGASGAPGAGALRLANGRRLPLVGGDLSVGRAPTNDLVLDDPTIAAQQARLLRFPEGWLLADLAGGASTAVNGQPVSYPVVLAPGDEIGLGRLVVAFEPDGTAAVTGVQSTVAGDDTLAAALMDGQAAAPADDETLAAPTWALPRPAARTGAPLVHLDGIVKTYAASAGPLTVLREVSLTIGAGEFVAIVGPSGCGKSTLLNVITGIDRPDAGTVIVAGQDIQRMGSDALARWRGRNIGIVFQFFQLLPTLTVAENVMLPMAFCQTVRGSARGARTRAVLRRVGMEHTADRLPSALSGGEQQRVAIARALANEPPILVADEPTGNLDSRTGRQIFELFARLVAAGTTVVLVTHDPVLAGQVPRRITMSDGRIVGDTETAGPPDDTGPGFPEPYAQQGERFPGTD
jgi:putative ABC transport system ATP-binding protein